MNSYLEFKDALRRFVQEVCKEISQVAVPPRLWTRIVRQPEGGVSFPQEERPDLTRLLFPLFMALHRNPTETLQHVIEVVRNDPKLAGTLLLDGGGKPITEEKVQQQRATDRITGAFLSAYLTRSEKPAFDENAFDAVFDQFIAALESSTVTASELSPLVNCHFDGERIDIAPGLAIRKLSSDETERWLNQDMEYPLMAIHGIGLDLVLLDCAIEVTYEKGRHEGWGSRQEIADMVSDLLTALRLLTDHNIHLAFTKRSSDSILEPGGGTSSSIRPHVRGPEAHLNPAMQQEIVDTLSRIRGLPTDSPVRLPLRRWDIVSERFNQDDALIDYWIALESLFVPESFQEVRYRASLRIAAFVGETAEEREDAYKDLRDSYELRSRIVHGGVPRSGQKSDLIAKTRSYLRRALLKILLANDPFNPEGIESSLLRK